MLFLTGSSTKVYKQKIQEHVVDKSQEKRSRVCDVKI